jgi:hypothetical protein
MTHLEITTQIALQGLREGDWVTIELTNGKTIDGKLAYDKVTADVNENNEIINSRIGLVLVAAPGYIYEVPLIPIYSENIKTLN